MTLGLGAAVATAAAFVALPIIVSRRPRWWWYDLPPVLLLVGCGLTYSYLLVTKWLASLVMPATLFWLLLYAIGVWLLHQRRNQHAGAVFGLVAAYALLGNGWLASSCIAGLEDDYPPPPAGERYDAVLVLGGGTSVGPDGRPELSHAGDRLVTAARMFHRGEVALIAVSGTGIAGRQPGERNLAAEARTILVELNVPAKEVLELPGPRNTAEELAHFATVVRERAWTRVGLVTSGYHMRRALSHADANGLSLIPITADHKSQPIYVNQLDLLPNAGGLQNNQLCAWEHLGRLAGR